MVRQAGARGDRLVAHLVPAGDARPSDEEIKLALRRHLPDYMTPSSVFWHDHLPLTRNGKVDRGRLTGLTPVIERAGQEPLPGRGAVGEHSELESRLVELWASVLRLPAASIAADADFYDLGGDSLAGARIFAGIRKQFGVSITLDRLYDLRHPYAMAATIAEAGAAS